MGSIICRSPRRRHSRRHDGRRPTPTYPLTALPQTKPSATDPRLPQGPECGVTACLAQSPYAYKRQASNSVGMDLC
jgi:hypothetical protein